MIKIGSVVRLITPTISSELYKDHLGVVVGITTGREGEGFAVRFVNQKYSHSIYYLYIKRLLEVS